MNLLRCCPAFFLLAACTTGATPKADPIRLPVIPPPPPAPAAVTTLAPDQLYVIDCDVPCLVLASPSGIVSIAEDPGPVKLRGTFVDGPGRSETRTYSGKSVFTVEAVGAGRVELLIVPAGGSTGDVLRRTLEVSTGKPLPQPGPGPAPPPAPTALWGFVIVEDTAEAVAARGQTLADPALAALLKDKGYRWRIVDKDVAGADGRPPADVAPCLAAAKGQPLPQVFVIDVKGNIVARAALVNAAGVIDLLKRYGG